MLWLVFVQAYSEANNVRCHHSNTPLLIDVHWRMNHFQFSFQVCKANPDLNLFFKILSLAFNLIVQSLAYYLFILMQMKQVFIEDVLHWDKSLRQFGNDLLFRLSLNNVVEIIIITNIGCLLLFFWIYFRLRFSLQTR